MEFKGSELFVSGLKDDLKEPDFIEALTVLGITKMPHIYFQRTVNGYFKGTARLTFPTHDEALAFKSKVNYKVIRGKVTWLTPYVPDKSFKDKKNEKCNLFVKLPATMKPEDFDAFMLKFGEIFSIKIKYDKAGVSQGYGYICYSNAASAELAFKACGEGVNIEGGKIQAFEFKSFNERNPDGLKRNNLLIKNIDTTWNDIEFKAFISKYGEVTSVKVGKEKETDPSNKGFGFACFKSVELAEKALKEIHSTKIGDKQLMATYHLKKEERKYQLQKERLILYKDRNVFVKQLPSHVNDAELEKVCSVYGKVTSARVFVEKVKDQVTNDIVSVSKGYGFVCFDKVESAQKFIEDATHKHMKFWDSQIFAAIPETKTERKKRMSKPKRMPMFPMGMTPMPMQRPPFMWDPYMGMPMPPMMMERPMMPPQYPPMPHMPMMKPKIEYEQMDHNQLGEIIYERMIARRLEGETAGKITGMILEMDVKLIAELLVNDKELDSTIREAMKALGEKSK